MKLEQQVCSLELAKKLKELGVKQESLFYWGEYKVFGPNKPLIIGDQIDGVQYSVYRKDEIDTHFYKEDVFSAFTVAELGEMLKDWTGMISYFEGWNNDGRNPELDNDKNWYSEEYGFYEKTEANVRSRLLIYLIEDKSITL